MCFRGIVCVIAIPVKSPAEAGLFTRVLPGLATVPIVHFLLRPVFCITVPFLKFSLQLVPLASDDIEVIIGQFSPLLLHLAFDLLPVSFDTIPVRGYLLQYENT
jgi:hypothetical protein